MHHMAFEQSYNILKYDQFIRAKLNALMDRGLVIKSGFKYKLFKEPNARWNEAKSKKDHAANLPRGRWLQMCNVDGELLQGIDEQ